MCCLHALRIAALYSTPGQLAQRALSLQVRQNEKGKKTVPSTLLPFTFALLPLPFCLTWTPLHGGI